MPVDPYHLYTDKAHATCCAGCDWWRWHNAVAGEGNEPSGLARVSAGRGEFLGSSPQPPRMPVRHCTRPVRRALKPCRDRYLGLAPQRQPAQHPAAGRFIPASAGNTLLSTP